MKKPIRKTDSPPKNGLKRTINTPKRVVQSENKYRDK
ncbi:hypothetical protein J2Z58_002880 [Halobacillus andaensis]|nr:hypothetical protein [Halobacillus andaensis]